jgi:hypothetical protein
MRSEAFERCIVSHITQRIGLLLKFGAGGRHFGRCEGIRFAESTCVDGLKNSFSDACM